MSIGNERHAAFMREALKAAREDGREVPSSVKYVHQKDEHLHRAVARVLGLPELPFGEM